MLLVLAATACATPESGPSETSEEESTASERDADDFGSTSEALIAGTDYDYTVNVSKTAYSGFGLSLTNTMTPRATRNNKFVTITDTWRASTDAASVRKAIATFAKAKVVNTGLPGYTSKTTINFDPRAVAVGTYYLYATFTTNGEDRITSIYRVIVTA